MAASVAHALDRRQATSVDLRESDRSTAVDLTEMRGWIVRGMSETGWTFAALEAHMGKDKSYIHAVLNGDKPLSLAFMLALPDDLEAFMAACYAESFGRIVVKPATGADAIRNLVSGLVGVLSATPQMPTKAGPQLKAKLKGEI